MHIEKVMLASSRGLVIWVALTGILSTFSLMSFACSGGNARLAVLQDNMHNYWQSVSYVLDGAVPSAKPLHGKQYGIASNETEHFNTKQASVALVSALLEPLGVTARADYTLPRARALRELEMGDVDLVVGLTRQAGPENLYYLQPAIGLIEQRLFVRADTQFSVVSWTDLQPLVGGILDGANFGHLFDVFAARNLRLEAVSTRQQNIERLLLGRIDYLFDYEASMAEWILREDYSARVKMLPFQQLSLPLYVVISKESPCYSHRTILAKQLRSLRASESWRHFAVSSQRL